MNVFATASGLRAALRPQRSDRSIGFVPTMGALHEGHVSLLEAARTSSDVVVMSIFVNPLQFGPREDFANYPRATKKDLALAEEAGVDLAFLPEVEEMYPSPGPVKPAHPQLTISAGPLGDVLEGASRPGHFDGVATVVAKLLNIVIPDKVFFGQKDAQQIAVIKRLIGDFSFGVELVVCPTVREADGLALSSRNAYLTTGQRARATILFRALQAGREVLEGGGDPPLAEKTMEEVLGSDPHVQMDYARAVDPDGFGTPAPGSPVLLAVAAKVGTTRLIDNLVVGRR